MKRMQIPKTRMGQLKLEARMRASKALVPVYVQGYAKLAEYLQKLGFSKMAARTIIKKAKMKKRYAAFMRNARTLERVPAYDRARLLNLSKKLFKIGLVEEREAKKFLAKLNRKN